MNDRSIAIRDQFRQALRDCKQLYIRAARAALEDQPDSDETARREMIRRMVDLHKGLLVKVYCVIAGADSKWSRAERELAGELVEHLWQQSVEGPRLKEVAVRMFRDSGNLEWYSLVRPFDRICRIRDLVPELDTVVMRLANLVAKADGTVNAGKAAAVAGIHAEIDLHLRRIPLEDDRESQAADSRAVEIVHRENPLLKPSAPASSPGMCREPARQASTTRPKNSPKTSPTRSTGRSTTWNNSSGSSPSRRRSPR